MGITTEVEVKAPMGSFPGVDLPDLDQRGWEQLSEANQRRQIKGNLN